VDEEEGGDKGGEAWNLDSTPGVQEDWDAIIDAARADIAEGWGLDDVSSSLLSLEGQGDL
jgi:hypothetical protein